MTKLRRPPPLSPRVSDPIDGSAERQSILACAGRRARRHLGYVRHLMTIEAQPFDNLTVNAFVGKKVHRGIVSSGYTTSARRAPAAKARAARTASSLSRGCASIICSTVSPAASFSKFDCNPGAGDHRLAHHHIRIGNDHLSVIAHSSPLRKSVPRHPGGSGGDAALPL